MEKSWCLLFTKEFLQPCLFFDMCKWFSVFGVHFEHFEKNNCLDRHILIFRILLLSETGIRSLVVWSRHVTYTWRCSQKLWNKHDVRRSYDTNTCLQWWVYAKYPLNQIAGIVINDLTRSRFLELTRARKPSIPICVHKALVILNGASKSIVKGSYLPHNSP